MLWYLDLQQLVQSVPITTKVVSSYPVHSEVYPVQHYLIPPNKHMIPHFPNLVPSLQ